MVSAVKNNLDAIRDACKMHRVESLYIFGSAARELDFADKSDIDFLYRSGRSVDLISMDHVTNPF